MEHSPLKNSLTVGFLALATLQISIIKKINKFVLWGKLDEFCVTLLSEYSDLTNG